MKFPRYWAREQNDSGRVVARGWSASSLEEARANAQARLHRILDALRRGTPPAPYRYVIDGVICEEVIDRIFDHDVETAVISRNAYGSLVMNTKRLMFVDIDLPPDGLWQRLKSWCSASAATPEQRALCRVRQWQRDNRLGNAMERL